MQIGLFFNFKRAYLFFYYYFMGSFAFPLISFSCIFSVWTKCYFQGNTCSFSCLVVKVYMCLNKRFDNTSELCKSKNKRFVRKKKPNPLPQLFLLERKKKMKTTPENSWVTTGMFRNSPNVMSRSANSDTQMDCIRSYVGSTERTSCFIEATNS